MVVKIDSSGSIWDTSANWATNTSYVLISGVRYYETDTGRLKVGTGATWANTIYSGAGMIRKTLATISQALTLSTVTQVFNFTCTENMTIVGWLDIRNMAAGDILEVRTMINSQVHSITSYSGAYADPIVYIRERECKLNDIYTITLNQTAGVGRTFYGSMMGLI